MIFGYARVSTQEQNLDRMKIKAINPQFVASFEEIFKGLVKQDD